MRCSFLIFRSAMHLASPHFSQLFVARRRKVVSHMALMTAYCAGIVDTMLSDLTELKPCGVRHSVAPQYDCRMQEVEQSRSSCREAACVSFAQSKFGRTVYRDGAHGQGEAVKRSRGCPGVCAARLCQYRTACGKNRALQVTHPTTL